MGLGAVLCQRRCTFVRHLQNLLTVIQGYCAAATWNSALVDMPWTYMQLLERHRCNPRIVIKINMPLASAMGVKYHQSKAAIGRESGECRTCSRRHEFFPSPHNLIGPCRE